MKNLTCYSLAKLLIVVVFTVSFAMAQKEGTATREIQILEKYQATEKGPIPLEVPYQIALDQIYERVSMRLIVVSIKDIDYDLCNLRMIFYQMKRIFPALHLTVQVYTDRSTLDAMVKFKQAEFSSGPIETDNSPAGLEFRRRRYKELGYPEKLNGRRAIYERNVGLDQTEEFIDYMPDSQSLKFTRLSVQ